MGERGRGDKTPRRVERRTWKEGSSWAWRMKEAAQKRISSPLKNDSIGGSATSFFFTNFPEKWAEEDLWKQFRKVGDIVDVFIARKRSLANKRFGFARFIKSRIPNSPLRSTESNVRIKSYAEALAGGQKVRKAPQPEEQVVNIITNKAIEDRMAKSLIGEALNHDKLKHIHDLVQAEGIVDIKLCYIGGFLVQLEFGSMTKAKEFKVNAKEVWSKWFKNLQEWSPGLDFNHRIASLVIIGLPPQAWLPEAFAYTRELRRK
ncbi:hypothetical protein LXL04_034525 [Taraxacum kok-saghyz]